MHEDTERYGSMFHQLVTDELRFCCIYSFLREIQHMSMQKVAIAMGVTHATIRYWRNKKFQGKIASCPRCPHPQTQLQLKKTNDGRIYFVRSYAR